MSRKNSSQTVFPFVPSNDTRLNALRKGQIPDEFTGNLTLYLLHFKRPVGSEKHSARHYVGVCHDLRQRLKQHRRGTGAKLTAEMKRQKIGFVTGHIWTGVNREFERYIKSWKRHSQFCECCHDVPFFALFGLSFLDLQWAIYGAAAAAVGWTLLFLIHVAIEKGVRS